MASWPSALVRTLCPDCRSEVDCDPKALAEMVGSAELAAPTKVYQPVVVSSVATPAIWGARVSMKLCR